MTFLKDSAVSGHKSINYESPIFQEHIQLSNSHGIFTPCLMNLKENIIEIYSNDYMKKKKLLYRFEVDKVNIQPNMSLKGFFISTNKDNLEILSEKTKYILRAIENHPMNHSNLEQEQDISFHKIQQNIIPSKLVQRLVDKQIRLPVKENMIPNDQNVHTTSHFNEQHSISKIKQSTNTSQSSSSAHQNSLKQEGSGRRGISSLIQSFSYHYSSSSNALNHDDDEDEDDKKYKGKYERNVNPESTNSEHSPEDESLSSESSSSDDDIDPEDYQVPSSEYPGNLSASDSLQHYFQQNNRSAELHTLTSHPNPGYLRSTRSSNKRVSSIDNEDKSSKIATKHRYTPFGPMKQNSPSDVKKESRYTISPIPKSEKTSTKVIKTAHRDNSEVNLRKAAVPSQTTRPATSSYSKKNSAGFFEKFSGRVRAPNRRRSGWGTMIEEGFEFPQSQSRRDSELLNMAERINSPEPSRGRRRSRSGERETWPRKSLSPTRLALIGASRSISRTSLTNNEEQLPPSINSLLHQSQLSRLRPTSISPQRQPASPQRLPVSRSKTPDDLKHRRPTPDTQRRNKLTDAAEWLRMSDWLSSVHMEKYCDNFKNGGVTKLSVVELLHFPDLVQLGIDRVDIPYILERIEEIRQMTKSFTDQAPLQFLPQKHTLTPPQPKPQKVVNPQITEKPIRTRIFLSKRDTNEGISKGFVLVSTSETSSNSLINSEKMLRSFDLGERSDCLANWLIIKEYMLNNPQKVSHELIEQIHPLEFYMRLSFAVLSLTSHGDVYCHAMDEFKVYLESLMRSEEDPLVTNFLNSRLYAAYGAIILVPNPRSNPAFSHLFEKRWLLGIRKRIETFLKHLASVPISSTDFFKFKHRNQISFAKSPTNSETELEMMQVLDTIEASEKLHKVLRESNLHGSSSHSSNITKQYCASLPKDLSHTHATVNEDNFTHQLKEEHAPDHPLRGSRKGRRMSAILGSSEIIVESEIKEVDDSSDDNVVLPIVYSSSSDSEGELELSDSKKTVTEEESGGKEEEEEEEEMEYDFSKDKTFRATFSLDNDPLDESEKPATVNLPTLNLPDRNLEDSSLTTNKFTTQSISSASAESLAKQQLDQGFSESPGGFDSSEQQRNLMNSEAGVDDPMVQEEPHGINRESQGDQPYAVPDNDPLDESEKPTTVNLPTLNVPDQNLDDSSLTRNKFTTQSISSASADSSDNQQLDQGFSDIDDLSEVMNPEVVVDGPMVREEPPSVILDCNSLDDSEELATQSISVASANFRDKQELNQCSLESTDSDLSEKRNLMNLEVGDQSSITSFGLVRDSLDESAEFLNKQQLNESFSESLGLNNLSEDRQGDQPHAALDNDPLDESEKPATVNLPTLNVPDQNLDDSSLTRNKFTTQSISSASADSFDNQVELQGPGINDSSDQERNLMNSEAGVDDSMVQEEPHGINRESQGDQPHAVLDNDPLDESEKPTTVNLPTLNLPDRDLDDSSLTRNKFTTQSISSASAESLAKLDQGFSNIDDLSEERNLMNSEVVVDDSMVQEEPNGINWESQGDQPSAPTFGLNPDSLNDSADTVSSDNPQAQSRSPQSDPFEDEVQHTSTLPIRRNVVPATVNYVEYLKGNFKGLEKTRSQIIREESNKSSKEIEGQQHLSNSPFEEHLSHQVEREGEGNENNKIVDSSRCDSLDEKFPKTPDTIEELSDGSVDENHEFCTPLNLQNLHNRGSFVVMTKEEEELARQSSFNSDDLDQILGPRKGSGHGTARLFKTVSLDPSILPIEGFNDQHLVSVSDTPLDSQSLEKKKSRISHLIEKFNQEKPQHEEVTWNGWELIGSRWVKKNPITDEEIEAAASFYSNTNRRHHTGKKKMLRHSSADLSNFQSEEMSSTRGRAKSISSDFWEDPTSLRQQSSCSSDLSPRDTRIPFDSSPSNPTNRQYDLL